MFPLIPLNEYDINDGEKCLLYTHGWKDQKWQFPAIKKKKKKMLFFTKQTDRIWTQNSDTGLYFNPYPLW